MRVARFTLEDLGVLCRHRADETVSKAAYENRSTAIRFNLHPAGFDELVPKTLASAIVDRLLNHAHVCQTGGEGVRFTQALVGQGASPLTTRTPHRWWFAAGRSHGRHRAVLMAVSGQVSGADGRFSLSLDKPARR
jgi:hypothetical protein